MKAKQRFFFVFAGVLACLASIQVYSQPKAKSAMPLSIGEVRFLRSKILNEERRLNIILPHKFDKKKAYPVIYLLDGSIDEDLLHIAGLAQFFNMQFEMPETIIVGIANIDRKRDFTFPTKIEELKKDYPTTGHSEKFIGFLEGELQPFIEAGYKTNGTKYLLGQSLGGLLAIEILLKKPRLFTHYLIVSPSLWWDDQSLVRQAPGLLEKQAAAERYVYISAGGKEHPVMVKDAQDIAAILQKSGKPGLKTDFLLLPEESHATILHQSINEAFKKLFPVKK